MRPRLSRITPAAVPCGIRSAHAISAVDARAQQITFEIHHPINQGTHLRIPRDEADQISMEYVGAEFYSVEAVEAVWIFRFFGRVHAPISPRIAHKGEEISGQ
ncbi:hypothetical protein [Cryobacterium psychrophilum]|uniref:hypothetical protein n=1 Tax=Cryobacterium psychrophilum TaxID=41988 RepID=UPI001416F739|nr:hypothetical protein [Cryobacterium psychrophilum]